MPYALLIAVLFISSWQPIIAPQGEKSMTIESAAFMQGKPIPEKYTCEGGDASPPMSWTNAPQGTKSFALIVDDPDAPAGLWVHWVLYNIPASTHALQAGIKKSEATSAGRQGVNDFKKIGYGGPCPPPGTPHRYFFKLYALDAQLPLRPRASKKDVEAAMQGHVLAPAQLIGTYQRGSQ
jgi:Raf kinase inhibitor-like YbhB/YbcL family protein